MPDGAAIGLSLGLDPLPRIVFEIDDDVPWQVADLRLQQRLDEPYSACVELRTDDLLAEPSTMLGCSATVVIERADLRHEIAGIVERVDEGGGRGNERHVTVTLVPALRALGMRNNSRIFQEKTIPEILEEVLTAGLEPFERTCEPRLQGSYPVQEYTVQYQETDLTFAHRLMEEAGISYWFRTRDGVETMVLVDDDSAHEDVVSLGNEDGVLAMVLGHSACDQHEALRELRRESCVRPTVARARVFDWLTPSSPVESENDVAVELELTNGAQQGPERETYEHGGSVAHHGAPSAGQDIAELDRRVGLVRRGHQRDAVRLRGRSSVTGLAPGMTFMLLDHPHAELAGRYLVTAVEHRGGERDVGDDASGYENHFECIPAEVPWVPSRRHPRPRIPGIQTATVVGPAGEEIFTDEHGRIKVQFHWDRQGQRDDASSCFMRVVQPWAGNGWGFTFLPRIGMEVAVTFVEGDPDRPVVTGCLYNGDNAPPYALPDEKTKSTIKTNSSPGGGGYNELRFEDAAGAEQIYVHAQRNLDEVVLACHTTSVGGDQCNDVAGDQTETVGGDQSVTVDGDRSVEVAGDHAETVSGDQSFTVSGDQAEQVGGDQTLEVSGDQIVVVGQDHTATYGGSRTVNTTGDHLRTTSGSEVTVTGVDRNETVGGNSASLIGGSRNLLAGGPICAGTPADVTIQAGGKINLVSAAETTCLEPSLTKTANNATELFGVKVENVESAIKLASFAMKSSTFNIGLSVLKIDICDFKLSGRGIEIKMNSKAAIETSTFHLIS